ncbi:MAG TPA: ATP-binding cassette domain-containing protein, partial [Nitrospinaceae bacterium]|nr:ATP-binding cassette domain-containing protein [Nitrospinaceae bacterium]
MKSLRAINLAKSYRNRQVVKGVSVEVKRGEIVGLLGPNGAGKTTTFYMVVGLTPPDEGQVLLGNDDITKFP